MDNSATVGPKGIIKKNEFVRLIIQSLRSMGYENAAQKLESESGIAGQSSEFLLLADDILNGNWDASITTLIEIENWKDESRASAAFLIVRQHILECLNRGEPAAALDLVRKHVSIFEADSSKKLHQLLNELVFNNMKPGSMEAIHGKNLRRSLLDAIEKKLPPSIVGPKERLEELVEMALTKQLDHCIYHNSCDTISPYEDHSCGRDQIPTETVQILLVHHNEVWFVQFSHNGEYLASASRDCTAIIWKVLEEGSVTLKHTLRSHQKPVSFVAWSPDDTMLLTCGNADVLKLWDVETGTCKHTFGEQSPIVCSCAWFPDSKRLVFGRLDADKCISICDLEGNEVKAWSGARVPRVLDLAVTPDGRYLIGIFSETEIRLYDLQIDCEHVISEKHGITSLSVSRDSEFLIANLTNEEIHMWRIGGTFVHDVAPMKFMGHKNGKYVIRSCFGGTNCRFIASGSEDAQVYIWHHQKTMPLEILSGHSSTVNSVSWNPVRPQMLASASDDSSIRIWGPSKKIE